MFVKNKNGFYIESIDCRIIINWIFFALLDDNYKLLKFWIFFFWILHKYRYEIIIWITEFSNHKIFDY